MSQSREAAAFDVLSGAGPGRSRSRDAERSGLLAVAEERSAARPRILEALDKDPSSEVRKKAVFALSQLKDDAGVEALIKTAKTSADPAVRSEAIFWLGQKAGKGASAAITDRIDNDPNTEVKKRAVFALSQMPAAEGVPLLINAARTNPNPEVRKQAMFWLGQSEGLPRRWRSSKKCCSRNKSGPRDPGPANGWRRRGKFAATHTLHSAVGAGAGRRTARTFLLA